MWIVNKFGAPINMDQAMSLYVDVNGDEGGYEVKANNSGNSPIAQFLVTPATSMTEPEADALLERMKDLLGVTDLSE